MFDIALAGGWIRGCDGCWRNGGSLFAFQGFEMTFEPLLADKTDLTAEVALLLVGYRFDGVVQFSIEIDC